MVEGLLLTAATILVTGVLLALARWMIPGSTKQEHHDVLIGIHEMVGMLYAVLLAFVVIMVWENASKVDDDTQIEANKVSQIHFTARGLPEPQRGQLTDLTTRYATVVIHQEWPLMRHGETSAEARALVAKMRVATNAMQPRTPRDEILMAQTLEAINELVEARRTRTAAVVSTVPPVLWMGLLGGTAITVGFTFFYDYTRYLPHFLMTSTISGLAAFMLWLTWEMSYPYDGPTGVGPDAFAQILERFREFS